MQLAQLHLAWWQSKRLPRWTHVIARQPRTPSIDELVNAHVAQDLSDGYLRHGQVGNTLTLIRMRMHRLGVSNAQAMADLSNCPASPRRSSDVAKWNRRIHRSKEPAVNEEKSA